MDSHLTGIHTWIFIIDEILKKNHVSLYLIIIKSWPCLSRPSPLKFANCIYPSLFCSMLALGKGPNETKCTFSVSHLMRDDRGKQNIVSASRSYSFFRQETKVFLKDEDRIHTQLFV